MEVRKDSISTLLKLKYEAVSVHTGQALRRRMVWDDEVKRQRKEEEGKRNEVLKPSGQNLGSNLPIPRSLLIPLMVWSCGHMSK